MTTLIQFDQAYQAIMVANNIDEVMEIRDKVEAMRLYLKQQRQSLEMQNACAEIKLWAERRAGEMILEIPRSSGGRLPERIDKNLYNDCIDKPLYEVLKENKIGNTTAHNFQSIASVPAEIFKRHIAETKAAQKELTSAGIINLAQQLKRQQGQNGHDSIIDLQKQLPPTDHKNCHYQDESTQIWLGDATNLDFISDNTVDLIVTSPPLQYWGKER